MKRIALLLAGTLLGTGCVVETTCDPQTLTLDWGFVDAAGNYDLPCEGTSPDTYGVDVWLDGTRVLTDLDACDYTPVQLSDVGTGWHRISVEGYSYAVVFADRVFLNRDYADVYVDECGDTYFAASPGEANLEVAPTNCTPGDGTLLYSIIDYSRGATPYNTAWYTRTSGNPDIAYSCVSGVPLLVPYGDYRLEALENSFNLSSSYAYTCSPTDFVVDYYSGDAITNVTYVDVPLTTGTAVCSVLN